MLSNAYFLAKFRFDTAENEPAKKLQNFRKMHFSFSWNLCSCSRRGPRMAEKLCACSLFKAPATRHCREGGGTCCGPAVAVGAPPVRAEKQGGACPQCWPHRPSARSTAPSRCAPRVFTVSVRRCSNRRIKSVISFVGRVMLKPIRNIHASLVESCSNRRI